MQKAIPIFVRSVGGLLLAVATALLLINLTNPPGYVLPHDPVFGIRLGDWFWIVGGVGAIVAFVCLFSERLDMPLFLLTWIGLNYLVIRFGLSWTGCHNLTGFLPGFSRAFAITPAVANELANVTFGYLLFGGCICLWLERLLPPAAQLQTMPCPACGGHVGFPPKSLGQRTQCPHCKASVTLRKAEETLKMSCFFCKEHIEFPAHALGRKIKCPHCKMEIGLKEEIV